MAINQYEKNGKVLYTVYVTGRDKRGRRHQMRKMNIETLHKARNEEFELKRKVAQLKEQDVVPRWHEWRTACELRMKFNNCKPSTLHNYKVTLGKWADPVWKLRDINTITKREVYELVFEKANTLITPSARKHLLKMIKRVFQMALEEGHITHNPCLGIVIKLPDTDQQVLTSDEVRKFLLEAKAVNHRFYPVWVMALTTGMRSGEMFALRWSDVDFDRRVITLTRQWTRFGGFGPTKTRQNRVIPISQELMTFLKEELIKRKLEDEFILPRLKEWFHGDQAEVTRDFCKAIGITPVKFHDLRATFITTLLAKGVSIAHVMAIVGHNSMRTTNGYLRMAGVDIRGATEALGFIIPNEQRPPAEVISIRKGGTDS
ncbi:MAG: site-specific integrase [Oligoflexia bacterium]|nr:site-specific integrase [Oligoflexia bacterium]